MKRALAWLLFLCILAPAFAQNGQRPISLDTWMKERKLFQNRAPEFLSMNDGQHFLVSSDAGDRIVKLRYQDGDTAAVLFDLKKMKGEAPAWFFDFSFSADEMKLMIAANRASIYRHSFTADYFIYTLGDSVLKPLSDKGSQQWALFSPDGSKVAFARGNNLFIKDLQSNEEWPVTKDGKENEVINGTPDWVYEEEFGLKRAFDWSPDGKYLAFLRFDESAVKTFSMNMFAGQRPEMKDYALYPGVSTFKYPKAGDDNSVVSAHLYSISDRSLRKLDTGSETDVYLPRIYWMADPAKLAVLRMNRLQNHLEVLEVNALTSQVSVIHQERNERFIDEKVLDDLLFLANRKEFVFASERDGWYHLFLGQFNGNPPRCLTQGEWDVTDLLGLDEKNREILVTIAAPVPWQREVWVFSLDGKPARQISREPGYNSASFSRNHAYMLLVNESASSPQKASLYNRKGKWIRDVETNKAFRDTLALYRFQPKEFFSFTSSEGVELHGWMIKPVGFDPSKKYPVLMTQYSGPNSQEVLDRFEMGWEQVLSETGFLVACVDPRGTGARGEEFRKCTYMNLGKLETIDQLEAGKYFASLPYVDAGRMAIWGWSYGGFISSSCLVKGKGLFKAGIAVAPVTNWRYYDNIYTERYMRKPQDNAAGYDDNSPLNFASGLQGNLLLCHGTADDNVHLQNTYEFAERLVQANKQFDMQIYTNRNHGIFGGNTRYHLFTLKTEFLKTHLLK